MVDDIKRITKANYDSIQFISRKGENIGTLSVDDIQIFMNLKSDFPVIYLDLLNKALEYLDRIC